MTEFDFLAHEKLGEGLYKVREYFTDIRHSFNIYVVVGDKKAAVIDTGLGVTGGLRRYIEENITGRLPIVCYMTHGDLDHLGSASLFDEIHMNHRELNKLDWNLNVERRFSDLAFFSGGDRALMDFCKERYVRNEDLRDRILDVEDGDILDLGDVQLLAVKVPGHTSGSMAYYNRAGNYALSGDATSPTGSWQRCRNLKECLHCHIRFMEMLPEDITIYDGHCQDPQNKQVLRDLKLAFEEILAGKNGGDTRHILPFPMVDPEELSYDVWQHQAGNVNVPYDRNTLL